MARGWMTCNRCGWSAGRDVAECPGCGCVAFQQGQRGSEGRIPRGIIPPLGHPLRPDAPMVEAERIAIAAYFRGPGAITARRHHRPGRRRHLLDKRNGE